MLRSINPFDQTVIAEFDLHDRRTVQNKIDKAAQIFKYWRTQSFSQRATLMQRVAELLRQNKEQYAKIMSVEMGKVIAESRAEVEKCASACDYFAQHAEQFLASEPIKTEASKSVVAYQPLGVVLAIMPWNFPLWQVFRFAAPSLMAGNVSLLKHAANVTQCSLMIEKIFQEAGLPEGVFQSLLVDAKDVEGIIADHQVAAVTLTGSEYAGTQVASAAGKHLKKTVLELGGSDPFVVLEDADLELAAKVATTSRMQNAGQSCIAAKRFIVVQSVIEEFTKRFKKNIEALRQGDPLDEKNTTGPIARLDLAEQLETQLQQTVNAGARLLTGGKREGCNFQPALLDRVRPGMVAFDEEIFGPVAAVIAVKNEEEAIQMANASRYGLGASVWTSDKMRGERVALAIESGSVFINSLMRSDQRLPFGGIKKSGYGRELSVLGIREFVNPKTIFVG
ncbi:MAG: NAD-dependent succinate-semialdehyde dehydrogenase [Bacteroidota bacterium]